MSAKALNPNISSPEGHIGHFTCRLMPGQGRT